MTPETLQIVKDTAGMFAFLLIELTALFLLISYLVGVLQMYVPPEKIRSILSSKHGKGYIVAAFLGAITPFCSCSTIPFLKGLLRAKAGFGPMMVFLFASPLLNPIVIALFIATFGLQIALSYFSLAMGVSIIAGFVLEKLNFEKYIIPIVTKETASTNNSGISAVATAPLAESLKILEPVSCCAGAETVMQTSACSVPDTTNSDSAESCCAAPVKTPNKWRNVWDEVWIDFKQAFPYLLIGVTLGALIHGFVPTDFITKYASEDNPLAIPFAAVVGIPLYLRAIALIPLSAAFVAKGMGIGAVMAFIIGSAGASIPEVILLRSMFKTQMILAFLGVVLGMAVLAGFVFNALF